MNEGVAWIHEQLRQERWLADVRRRAGSPAADEIRPSPPRRRKTARRGSPSPDA